MVERILFAPGGATEAKQDDVLAALALLQLELDQKFESGESVALDAATLAALETVNAAITNWPVDYPLPAAQVAALTPPSDTLTDVELRATPVPVSGAFTITDPVTVEGEVALTAATLAALETINAVCSGTVALDAGTLAALESITATVSNWPIEYPLPAAQVTTLTPQTDGLTDVELRAAPIGVSATDFDIRELTVDTDSVRQTLRVLTPLSVAVTGVVADQMLVSIGAGDRIRLLRNAGHCDPALAAETYPLVTLKIGSLVVWRDKLEPGLPWSETVCFEGAVGEDLTISVDQVATIYLNIRYEVLT